jgi:hypothetical protein
MKQIILYLLGAFLFIAIVNGCDDEPEPLPENVYQIRIIEPSIDFVMNTDTLKLHIEFSDSLGGVVENVKVRFYSLADNTVVYEEPDSSAVASSGTYTFTGFRLLNDLPAHSNWVLEARVWGKNPGESEVVKTKGIHVHGK